MLRLILLLFNVLYFIGEVSAQDNKPNIIIIYVDDLGYGDLSCYGATHVSTPNIDQLAEKGIIFTDGHCSSATCTPSRFSLLTGRYAFRNKAAVLPGDAPMLINEDMPTLPGMLQQNGYKTAVIGKWHLGLGDGNVDWNGTITPGPAEIGFDYSYLIPATGDRVPCVIVENQKVVGLDKHDPIQVSYNQKIGTDPTGIENGNLVRFEADGQHNKTIINGVSRIGYMTGGNAARWRDETVPYQMLHKARTFINENKEQPFFLYFAFHDIHVPRLPDHQFEGATKMGPRGDAIVQMDYITGKLLDYLDSLDIAENTLVVFSSDNGPVLNDGYNDRSVELLGDHKPGGPFRGGKYSVFEAGTRVPTIVSWPEKIEPGKSDALVNHIDLYASIAHLVGHDLKENEAIDSENQLDAFLGESKIGKEFMLEEAYTMGLRMGKYKYIQPSKSKANTWIDKTKKIESGISTTPQLYNLESENGELTNIADKKQKKVKMMEAELQRILKSEATRK